MKNMDNRTIKEVIVVEGKNDTNHLKKYFNVDTLETNGLGINKATIELIKKINETRGVILLLDPDTPGEKIRRIINNQIPDLKNVFLYKKEARTKRKVGVEHASKEVLETALRNSVTFNQNKNELSFEVFYKLGLIGQKDSKHKRDKISKKYRLGSCNAKSLFKRLNMIGVSEKELINE